MRASFWGDCQDGGEGADGAADLAGFEEWSRILRDRMRRSNAS